MRKTVLLSCVFSHVFNRVNEIFFKNLPISKAKFKAILADLKYKLMRSELNEQDIGMRLNCF